MHKTTPILAECQNPIVTPSLTQVRTQFPALDQDCVFLENAGGSQVPGVVADAIHRYLTQTYVQLGAPYEIARRSTAVVDEAHAFANQLMNGKGRGTTILGPSTTQLVTMLAECYSRLLQPGDEIIICETAHEANAGPWAKLERFGMVVRLWRMDPETFQCSLDDLRSLLTPRTKIVAFPHVSNLLGEVVDVTAITRIVHEAGARVVVDGVAYAPHRAIDVAAWNVDFYVYSAYKVLGPHMAALYARQDALEELEGPNHFFLPNGDAYKFELGGANHESCAGLLALGDYLSFLAGGGDGRSRAGIERAFTTMEVLELPLQAQLLEALNANPRVRVIGPKTSGRERVCTISFLHENLSPPEITARTDAAGIGIRYGHMYAYRMCVALGIGTETGVTRVSMAHYNTPQEIERLLSVMDL